MGLFSVGPSSFGALKGITQYVSTQRVADQVNSLCYEFDTQKAQNGDRLSVNEAIRSDARQYELWDEWETYLRVGHPVASLAAKPLTSTHRVTIGTALDFGITRSDGTNRAPTADEWAWIHSRAALRGIRFTGASFNPREEWHHNGGYAESVAPISGVRIANTPITIAPTAQKDDDMANLIWNKTTAGDPHNGDVWVIDGLRSAYKTQTSDEIYDLGRTLGILSPGQNWQTVANVTISTELQARLRAIKAMGGVVSDAGKDLL